MHTTNRLKRILIITYYWPPSAGSGVQRWLKFAKYLPDYGWQPVIFTPENPDFDLKDDTLLKDIPAQAEIIKRPIWEPYQLLRLFKSKKAKINTGFVQSKKDNNWKSSLLSWIRGNFFIPDPRVFWKRPSVRFLSKYLKENPVDVIVTTGPPHSMHLIGLGLKKKLGIPWIVDIRDPWSKLDFLDNFKVTKRNRAKYERMEKTVLDHCDIVLATSYSMKELLQPFDDQKYFPITNGYDKDDFEVSTKTATNKFTIFHAGLLNAPRNPALLWEALTELCQESEAFAKKLEIRLAGTIDPQISGKLQQDAVLQDKLQLMSYLPHDAVIQQYAQSSVLLLLINNTYNSKVNIPGKLFEYLAIRRPILAIGGRNADAITIVEQSQTGFSADYPEKEKLKEIIWKLFQERGLIKPDQEKIERYSRKRLTGDLVEVLNKKILNILNS